MNKYTAQSRLAKKARHKARSCEHKVRYATAEEAKANPYSQDSYACKFCGGWHLTGAIYKTIGVCRRFSRKLRGKQAPAEPIKLACPKCGGLYTPMHAREKCPTCRGIG